MRAPLKATHLQLPCLFLLLLCLSSCERGVPGVPAQRDVPSRSDIQMMLIKLSACTGFDIAEDGWAFAFSILTNDNQVYLDQMRDLIECLRPAEDCDEVLQCDVTISHQERPCDPTSFSSGCIDNGFEWCDEDWNGNTVVFRHDCNDDPDGNTRCTNLGLDWCHAGSCSEDSSACVDNVVHQCYRQLLYLEDCGRKGLTCIKTDEGVQCVFSTKPCDKSHCEGDTSVICDEGRVAARYNCGELGMGCLIEDETSGCVSAGPEECPAYGGYATCEGSVGRTCWFYQYWEFDCGSFMNSTCLYNSGDGELFCVVP